MLYHSDQFIDICNECLKYCVVAIICSLDMCVGDDPEHVKTKLRHWAQAVACSLMQSH